MGYFQSLRLCLVQLFCGEAIPVQRSVGESRSGPGGWPPAAPGAAAPAGDRSPAAHAGPAHGLPEPRAVQLSAWVQIPGGCGGLQVDLPPWEWRGLEKEHDALKLVIPRDAILWLQG
jgi:hypothetical protein